MTPRYAPSESALCCSFRVVADLIALGDPFIKHTAWRCSAPQDSRHLSFRISPQQTFLPVRDTVAACGTLPNFQTLRSADLCFGTDSSAEFWSDLHASDIRFLSISELICALCTPTNPGRWSFVIPNVYPDDLYIASGFGILESGETTS